MTPSLLTWTPSMVAQRFVEFYRFAHRTFIYDGVMENEHVYPLLEHSVWRDRPEYHLPLAILNNGDCYVAAVAIGEVLAHMGYQVRYHDNVAHVFISVLINNKWVYTDTIYPEGKLDEETMLKVDEHYDLQTLPLFLLVEDRFNDLIDKEFVTQFVRFFHPSYTFNYLFTPSTESGEWYYALPE